MDDKEEIITKHGLVRIDIENPYGFEVYEQETEVNTAFLKDIENKIKYKFGRFTGKEKWMEFGKTYKNGFLSHMFNYEHILMLDILNKYKPISITEIACGWGKNLQLIFNHLSFIKKVIAIDISPTMLNQCKELFYNCNREVTCIEADFANIPLEQISDWVFVFNSLLYCEPKALKKLIDKLSTRVKHFLIMREPYCSHGPYRIRSETSFFHNYRSLLKKYDFDVCYLKNSFISILVKF